MNLDSFDLVASLHALPETDPIEIDGIQLGRGGGNNTCQSGCLIFTINVLQTICILFSTC